MSTIDLELSPTISFPRRLKVSWRTGIVAVMQFSPAGEQMFSCTCFERDCGRRLSLEFSELGSVLWVGDTAFDLSAAEFKRLRDTFGPLGLPIEPPSPLTTVHIPPVVHEAAPVTSSPRDGTSGESPSSDCSRTDGGTSENCVLVKALTSHESH